MVTALKGNSTDALPISVSTTAAMMNNTSSTIAVTFVEREADGALKTTQHEVHTKAIAGIRNTMLHAIVIADTICDVRNKPAVSGITAVMSNTPCVVSNTSIEIIRTTIPTDITELTSPTKAIRHLPRIEKKVEKKPSRSYSTGTCPS